jgi:hypothetical protein
VSAVYFNLSLRVEAAKLIEWQPEQVAALMQGIAQVLAVQSSAAQPLAAEEEAMTEREQIENARL